MERVLSATAEGQQRILLTLATGTGKTFIAFQIAWKLFHSRWNLDREPTRRPRVLFLADRNILANQAYNAFSAFPEDAMVRIAPADIRKKGRVPKNGSLFFTIFQTFLSGPPKDGEPSPYFGDYPPDFFDFIVTDECHRGGANDESTWRAILDYFAPAVQLGLTATPKRKDNVDTYAYFGEPVYVYSLKDGINDGELGEQHLRDFQDNEKTIPTILTTSQKLSTGVDARNIRNIVLMRPIKSMIEFKQIIGRGTRLYDGKDYFTIYDFVKAHHYFNDPEWDGEPLDPEPAPGGPKPPSGPKKPGEPTDPRPEPTSRIKVQLADGKARTIQSMMCTTFWHPDGTPMSAQQFMELLFGRLPDFFRDEAELRSLWGDPETRKRLLQGLAEKGFGGEQLAEMQRIIDAEKSDLFDVLAHVAYALPTVTREERAARAKVVITAEFSPKQQVFLDFVLSHYVSVGVEELEQEKLTPLLRLKYHDSLHDALSDLGRPDEIGRVFSGFQKYLYQRPPAL